MPLSGHVECRNDDQFVACRNNDLWRVENRGSVSIENCGQGASPLYDKPNDFILQVCMLFDFIYEHVCKHSELAGRFRGHLQKEESVPHRAISGC